MGNHAVWQGYIAGTHAFGIVLVLQACAKCHLMSFLTILQCCVPALAAGWLGQTEPRCTLIYSGAKHFPAAAGVKLAAGLSAAAMPGHLM